MAERLVGIYGDPNVGGVGRILDPFDHSFTLVGFQQGKPIPGYELNLAQQTLLHLMMENFRRMVSSGVYDKGQHQPNVSEPPLGYYSTGNPSGDPITDWSNKFRMGVTRVNVYGYPLTLKGYGDTGDRNVIELPTPPTSGTRTDLVFLEAWFAEVGPPWGGDVRSTVIHRYGGEACGALDNNIVDPDIAEETSFRVQFRWRIRTVAGASDITASGVKARGGNTEDTNLTFSVAEDHAGLFLAGNGSKEDAVTLKTVDGRVYALNLFRVQRSAGKTDIEHTDIIDVRDQVTLLVTLS